MSMATLLGDAGRLEEGLTFIERAVESGEKNPDVYNNFGAYLLRLGKYEQLPGCNILRKSDEPEHFVTFL